MTEEKLGHRDAIDWEEVERQEHEDREFPVPGRHITRKRKRIRMGNVSREPQVSEPYRRMSMEEWERAGIALLDDTDDSLSMDQ